jgi:hypothetical protein
MRRGFATAMWLALVAVATVAFVAQPHVVERWALYLGPGPAPSRGRLFLDPFPNAMSCESRVRLFHRNGESAFCASRRELAFGSRTDAILAADFQRIIFGGAYCAPRTARQFAAAKGG